MRGDTHDVVVVTYTISDSHAIPVEDASARLNGQMQAEWVVCLLCRFKRETCFVQSLRYILSRIQRLPLSSLTGLRAMDRSGAGN
jgi:hypothetical protein